MSQLRPTGAVRWTLGHDGVTVIHGEEGDFCPWMSPVEAERWAMGSPPPGPRLETPGEYAQRRARENIDRATGRR